MQEALLAVSYLLGAVLFILSLRGLSSQETARQGNIYGMTGMAIALAATLIAAAAESYALAAFSIAIGASIGALAAGRVAMTAMPEMVALLHSLVGAAAVLVGFAGQFEVQEPGLARSIHLGETYAAVVIGALTFTGSVTAFLKLRGSLSGKPLLFRGRHAMSALLAGACVVLAGPFIAEGGASEIFVLGLAAATAGVLGVHLVMGIGGADMPVVVSLLNSYSGWTASAAGFMLSNDLLIITGALVGSSGAILSYIMCRAMNRSILNVIFGGFGAQVATSSAAGTGEGTVLESTPGQTAQALLAAKRVVIVPGYGLAVARAQHLVRELVDLLRAKHTEVRFAIHPVAGRLPGHMNVLLAEARVPYDIVLEMDEINRDFPGTDAVLVVGANDIVNPGAQTDPESPIYGMPVLEVWKASRVFMLKRGRAAGYAGIDNPLYYHENTRMVFGDALVTLQAIVGECRPHP
jgi:H+-translocating NAD(P) transhydrogenase subunit beta